jgi:hypothetical protein
MLGRAGVPAFAVLSMLTLSVASPARLSATAKLHPASRHATASTRAARIVPARFMAAIIFIDRWYV